MVEAIMEDRRPRTHAKGNDMARARAPRSDTCVCTSLELIHFEHGDREGISSGDSASKIKKKR